MLFQVKLTKSLRKVRLSKVVGKKCTKTEEKLTWSYANDFLVILNTTKLLITRQLLVEELRKIC